MTCDARGGTPYSVLYDACLKGLKSYDLAAMDDDEVYDVMRDYLRPAIVMYTNCKSDLSDRDDEWEHFNFTLSDADIEVLARYMLICFVDANYICVPSMMKATLSSTDFNSHSGAALLDKIIKIRERWMEENKQVSGVLSYRNSKLFETG